MKDLLTTISSIFVILFSLSVLFLAEPTDAKTGVATEQEHDISDQPLGKPSLLFTRVQGAKIKNGVLIFMTLEEDGLKDHYFPLRGRNVVLSQTPDKQLPVSSIQFTEETENCLRINISPSIQINLLEELTAL